MARLLVENGTDPTNINTKRKQKWRAKQAEFKGEIVKI